MTVDTLLAAASLSAQLQVSGRTAAYERLPAVYQQPPAIPDAPGSQELASLASAASEADMAAVGTSGTAVRLLQQMLAAQRHDPGPDDGDFGERTRSAVRAFQAHRGLTVDGLVGPQTLGELAAPFLRRFLDGLSDVFDPVLDQLDNLAGSFDVDTAPVPVLRWWAWLLGAELVEPWPESRRRRMVRGALELHHRRGTVRGIKEMAAAFLDVGVDDVTVSDGGDTQWSFDPDAAQPGASATDVVVGWREGSAEVDSADVARLHEALLATLPIGYTLAVTRL